MQKSELRDQTMTSLRIAIAAAAITMIVATLTWAQSGSRRGGGSQQGSGSRQREGSQERGRTQQRRGSDATRNVPFEQRFWAYLKNMHYENWAPMPGTTADAYPGQEPHGAFVNVYANRAAAGSPTEPPHGSVLVKENYGADGKQLMGITAMYRTKDYDPENNDWYWVKYDPDGRVSQNGGMPVAGRVQMCAECHSGADGNDYLFAND